MGGGGGGYRVGPGDMDEIKREVDERTERSMAEAEINDLLARALIQINFRDTEATARLLDAIADALGDDLDFEKLNFGGSIAKHTYVDGLSDVDSLVFLGGDDVAELNPAEARQRLEDSLNAKLAKGNVQEISTGNLAVTVKYADGTEIQLLPARELSDGTTQISSADGSTWKSIKPREFAQALTQVNKDQAGAVIPTIKLAKGIIAGLPSEAQLAGYHVEALAVAAFTGYKGPRNPREMLTQFFSSAAKGVKRSIADTTGQSSHIDEALGKSGSAERLAAAKGLESVASRMQSASKAEDWQALLDS